MRIKSRLALSREFVSNHYRECISLLFLLIFEAFLAAASVLAIVPFVDSMLSPSLIEVSSITNYLMKIFIYFGVEPSFWNFGFLFIAINFLSSAMEVFVNYSILRFKYRVLKNLLGNTIKDFLSARINFFNDLNQGQIQNTLNREIENIGDALGHVAGFIAQLVRLTIYLIMPLFLNAQMTVVAVCLAIMFGSPFFFIGKLSYKFGKLNTRSSNDLMGVMGETLGSARIILSFGIQEKAYKKYLKAYESHVEATLPSQTLAASAPKMYKPIAMLAVVIAMSLAIKDIANLSELVAVMWSLIAVTPILASLLQVNIKIRNFLPSYEQLSALRDLAQKSRDRFGKKIFKHISSGIEFRAVDFKYSQSKQALSNINLHIAKGRMTAIVGESGAGKSTLIDLVLGLQIADKGKVLINDYLISEWELNSFRRSVGYVPQDSQLFHATIKENLLWSADEVSEDDLWEALNLANADAFVRKLPKGIDTVVGDRGVRMSGGQRQRLAIARAILRKPELLILDEATSSLDVESESLIQKSIENFMGETTILVVAHRLSTIAKADYIYVLNHGRVSEQGTYSELSSKESGFLVEMINLQKINKVN